MEMHFLVQILQVNIALGILYVGLKEFRFREKLFSKIAETISDYDFVSLLREQNRLGILFSSSEKFSEHFHIILKWIRELPDDYRLKIKGIETCSIPESQPGKTTQASLRLHRWFLKNRDKYLAWYATIIPSLLTIWWAYFFGTINQEIGLSVAVVGELVLVVHVILGRKMAQGAQAQVSHSTKIVMEQFRKKVAENEMKEASSKLGDASL